MTSWEKSLLVLASAAGGAEDDTGVAAHAHAALGRVVASSFGATNEAEREGNSHFFSFDSNARSRLSQRKRRGFVIVST